MTKQKQLLFLVGLLTLASCSREKDAPSVTVPSVNESSTTASTFRSLPNGPATLSFDLIRANRADAVSGSTARLYRSGDRSRILAQAITNADGNVTFGNIPFGLYDITFSKTGSAGSELSGITLGARQSTMRIKVAQFDARDPTASTQVPRLMIQTPSAQDADGNPTAWKFLLGGTFKDKITVRAYTARNFRDPQFIMRYVMFSVVTFDKNGQMQEWREGLSIIDAGKIESGPNGNQYTPAVDLTGSGLSGDIYLQVSGMDFNDNRAAYLIPVRLEKDAPTATVAAPTGVRAVSHTLQQQINYIYSQPKDEMSGQSVSGQSVSGQSVSSQAAPEKGNLWVNIYWDKPADLDSIQGYKILRAESEAGPYTEVAFASNKACTTTCSARDYTATLQPNKTYFYQVSATGSNVATSSAAKTYTLPRFVPELINPASEQEGVDLNPMFTLKADFKAIGATGAYLDFNLEDTFTTLRQLSIPKMNISTVNNVTTIQDVDDKTVYLGEAAPNKVPNLASFDVNTGLLKFPHEINKLANKRKPIALQPNRRYNWYVHAGYAYRLLDDTLPQSDSNPIVAYSVYSDPDRTKVVPDGAGQNQVDIHHFITRP